MPRMKPIEPRLCRETVGDLFSGVQARLGMTPNLLLLMANAPPVLEGFLCLEDALERGVLPPRLRRQISLAVAERDRSRYSAAAHAAFGRAEGLSDEEISDARQGRSANSKAQAALRFACELVDKRGHVGDDTCARLRAAGYGDREMIEITAWVCTAIFSDYLAQVTQAEVDFPTMSEISHT